MKTKRKNSEIIIEEKHLIEKYKSKKDLPEKIRLDACTFCQLKCPCCPMDFYHKEFSDKSSLGYLTIKSFKQIVDDNYLEEIELSNRGEIFLNPELIEIMKYAYKKNIRLTAYAGVNLNTLSEEVAEALVRYQFHGLVVSLDGASQETYSQYRVGGNYDNVINNIKKIQFYKKKYMSSRPKIEWKFIPFGHNEHEIIKAKEEAKRLNIPIKFEANWDPNFSPIKNKEFVEKETGLSIVGSHFERFITKYREEQKKWFFCKLLWEQPQINWDGRILGCCVTYENDFGGNAFEDGLINALNSSKLIYAKNLLKGNAEPIDGIPCIKCRCYKKLKELNIYIEPKKNKLKPNFSVRRIYRRIKNNLFVIYYEIKDKLIGKYITK